MSDSTIGNDSKRSHDQTPSEEFTSYCEAEFERRINSGGDFDEQRYRQAMKLVVEKLRRLEEEGAA